MKTIHNLTELCAYLSADRPSGLNRRIYKDTECGASISVRVGRPPEIAHRAFAVHAYVAADGFQGGTVHVLIDGKPLASAPAEVRDYFLHIADTVDMSEAGWTDFTGDDDGVMRWAGAPTREGLTLNRRGTIEIDVATSSPDPIRWIHNGQREGWAELDAHPERATAFTIQSIVEGSDAEVNSAPFVFPVPALAVDNWIDDMEARVSELWDEANTEAK